MEEKSFRQSWKEIYCYFPLVKISTSQKWQLNLIVHAYQISGQDLRLSNSLTFGGRHLSSFKSLYLNWSIKHGLWFPFHYLITHFDLDWSIIQNSQTKILNQVAQVGNLEMFRFLCQYYQLNKSHIRDPVRWTYFGSPHRLCKNDLDYFDRSKYRVQIVGRYYFRVTRGDNSFIQERECPRPYGFISRGTRPNTIRFTSQYTYGSLKEACINGHLNIVAYICETYELTACEVVKPSGKRAHKMRHYSRTYKLFNPNAQSIQQIAQSHGHTQVVNYLEDRIKLLKRDLNVYQLFRVTFPSFSLLSINGLNNESLPPYQPSQSVNNKDHIFFD